MQEQAWIEMLCRIPVSYHDGLVLSTTTGVDVVMQTIVRIEDEFLILRGRPAGTNETGKIIVIPFFQITFLTLPGKPSEKQVQAIFGDLDTTFAASPASGDPSVSESKPEETPAVGSNGATSPPQAEQAAPTKAMLLAKLRAKFAGENSMSGRGK